MLMAYKGFNKDLTCTMGKGRFQYEEGKWFEEPEANCVKNGFHCAEDPLDCLNYYGDWDKSVYYIVLADGDVHEDASDTKISCTRMKLVKKLELAEFVIHALNYMDKHPFRKMSRHVKTEQGVAEIKDFVVVRGKAPRARGKIGSVLGLAKENPNSCEIVELGIIEIDGKEFLPDVWYDVECMEVKADED